jgi:hypothetical protein
MFILRDIHIETFAEGFQDKIFDTFPLTPLLDAELSLLWSSGLTIILIVT